MIAAISQAQALELNIEVTPSGLLNTIVGQATILFRNHQHGKGLGALKPNVVALYDGPNIILTQPFSILTTREVEDVVYECLEKNGITTVKLIYRPDETRQSTLVTVDGLRYGDIFPLALRMKGVR